MTAKSIESLQFRDQDTLQALGGLIVQRTSTEATSSDISIQLNQLPSTLCQEGAGARKIGIAATVIKERFQALSGNMKADERDAKRAALREESVRMLFKTFEMLPNSSKVDSHFQKLYKSVEQNRQNVDRMHLVELMDQYESHPAIKVFNTLAQTSTVSQEDIVFMRCNSLVLIDEQTAVQQ